MSFSWTCPFCHQLQTVVSDHHFEHWVDSDLDDKSLGSWLGFKLEAILCANSSCARVSASAQVGKFTDLNAKGYFEVPLFIGRLVPQGAGKPQPDYIPLPIVEDYFEACKIVDLSPKAAATLARRCIQGMIRDFCGISKPTLFQEIGELRNQLNAGTADRAVSPESVEALDHVRKIGNIGAHMEADINLIVSVDPDEARALIELIELLFEEWYVAKRKREERFAKIEMISLAKDAEKKSTP